MATGPNLLRVMDVMERRAKLIQPPDYWTTVRTASWPSFGSAPDDIANLVEECPALLFWGDTVEREYYRQENSGELSPGFRVAAAMVFKAQEGLQELMAMGTADMIQFFRSSPEWNDPEYAGPNTWAVYTAFPGDRGIGWAFPKIAGAYGVGIVFGEGTVAVRHPMPKG